MAEVYAVKHDGAAGHWMNVALFNWSDKPEDKTIDLQALGFHAGIHLHAFDFWEEKYFPVEAGVLEFKQIPPHGCKLLRFCEADGKPCLVGDTLHTAQGAEITEWRSSATNLSITTMDLEREATGSLWLWLPQEPTKVTVNGKPGSFKVQDGLFHVPLTFTGNAQVNLDW
jgi:hypothetical protein